MFVKLTIDRFENGYAVCFDDNEKKYDIPKNTLPNLREDDIFTADMSQDGKVSNVNYLKEETERKKAEILENYQKLFESIK